MLNNQLLETFHLSIKSNSSIIQIIMEFHYCLTHLFPMMEQCSKQVTPATSATCFIHFQLSIGIYSTSRRKITTKGHVFGLM
jgi:hypothetical protein